MSSTEGPPPSPDPRRVLAEGGDQPGTPFTPPTPDDEGGPPLDGDPPHPRDRNVEQPRRDRDRDGDLDRHPARPRTAGRRWGRGLAPRQSDPDLTGPYTRRAMHEDPTRHMGQPEPPPPPGQPPNG